MKPDKLNNVFEELSPSEEQKKRMFDNIMSMKEKPQKNKKIIFPKFTLAASVAAVMVAVGIGSLLNKTGMTEDSQQNNPAIALNQTDVVQSNSTVEPYTEAMDKNEINEKSREEGSSVNDSVLMDTVESVDDTVTPQSNEIASDDVFESEITVPESIPEPSQSEPELNGEQPETSEDFDSESVNEENILLDDEEGAMVTVAGSGAGDGAGGGGGGGVAAKENPMKPEYIRDYPEFEQYFPNYIVDGFVFYKMTVGEELYATFLNSEGKKITVTVAQTTSAGVITPEQIEMAIQDGTTSFAIQCGEYYVTYYTESDNVDELYKMAVSSDYFK